MDVFNPQFHNFPVPVASFLAGAILHVGLFRFNEWDPVATQVVVAFGLLYALLHLVFNFYLPFVQTDSPDGFFGPSWLFLALLGGIYTSMLLYRVFVHPLRRFPGPFLARLSSFYAVGLSMKKFHMYEEVQRLHKSYGDIVRLGPSELSVASPEAVQAIHSNSSPCLKGPWYNIFQPMVSLHASRDKQEHGYRRKVWDKAFNARGRPALRDYEPRVAQYTQLLLNRIEESSGKPLDISLWFDFYGFDVMGDLAFGKSFDMLGDGTKHSIMELTQKFTLWGTQLGRSSWAYLVIKSIPILNYKIKEFLRWLQEHVKNRTETEPERPDIFSWLLGAYRSLPNPSKQDEINLQGDAHLIVVAGSDTTSGSLTSLLFELALHPEVYKKLQREVDECFSQQDQAGHAEFAKLKYLQAVIDEAMRLHPAIPSGVQRVAPPEGVQVGDAFIPGNTIIQVPTYTINRDERSFACPDDFIPERWTTQPELVKNRSIFAPFSIGRYSCAGKQLGLMEIRGSGKTSRSAATPVPKLYISPQFPFPGFIEPRSSNLPVPTQENMAESQRDRSPSDKDGCQNDLPVTAQRLRKRELDRKAQRAARAKTKSRIAHLESLVESIRNQDAEGNTTALMEQLGKVKEERDSLIRVLENVQDSIKTQLRGLDCSSISSKERNTRQHGSKPPAAQLSPPQSSTQPEMEVPLDPFFVDSAPSMVNPTGSGLVLTCSSASTCECSSSRTRRLPDGTEVNFSIWQAANDVLCKPDPSEDSDTTTLDLTSSDIAVRAVMEGWHSVEKMHKLSPAWEKIRKLDQLGFLTCSQTERLAILWMIHVLMSFQKNPTPERAVTLPLYYHELPSQRLPHSQAIDYLVWPGVRDQFIWSEHRYCRNMFWHLFSQHLRLLWPMDFHDCYSRNIESGRYQISAHFKRTIQGVECWTMERDFFHYYPELKQSIPVFLTIPIPMSEDTDLETDW
ncbi:hypothetical protein ACJZ2D_007360 [Fusarium nematophilum]